MIPEREREALMRLTMCAREECSMCKYQDDCNFDFQYELATKNMNILAEALRKLNSTETSTNSEKVQLTDEPRTGCKYCKHFKADADGRWCWREGGCEKYEPQTDCPWK